MTHSLPSNIILDELNNGLPGITKSWGAWLSEASKACFDNQGHISGVKIMVEGIADREYKVIWAGEEITEQVKRSWNDTQEMTEYGACGVAILLVLKLTDYTIIERSRKGTGFDYWLGDKDSEIPFKNSARLEVSGILKGDEKLLRTRVGQKLKQTHPTDAGNLPAFVVVVEFGEPRAGLVKK